MKQLLLSSKSIVWILALGFALFLPTNESLAQCPDWPFVGNPSPECDNQGTADPSDDLYCFNDVFFLGLGVASPFLNEQVSISVGGTDVGTYTFTPQIVLDDTYCFSAFVNPYEVVITDANGCTYTYGAPNEDGFPTCSDCSDSDSDGVCDDVDVCDGGDDNLDSDGDGVPDECDLCPDLADVSPGDACPSDGDDCTEDGVVDANCDCVYTLIDADGDGVCDADDICDGSDDTVDSDGDGTPDGCDACPALADLVPGDACPSDGDDCTDDGVVSATCECTSTPIDSPECNPTEECEVCESSGSNTCYEYIKKVTFGCDANYSGNDGGYGDYTGSAWDMHCGYWYGLTLKPGFNGCAYWENWNIWIDWNQDCDFDDADEHIGQACYWGNVYGQISVPDHALAGNATMRISMSYDGYADSCDNFEYGEVEDYTINVICDGNGHAPIALSTDQADLLAQAQVTHQENEQADAMLRPGYIGTDRDRTIRLDLQKDLTSELELLVYPNPVKDFVNISTNAGLENGTVTVYDNVGRIVYRTASNDEAATISVDVSAFSAGIYTVAIEGESSLVTKQFVVID